MGIDYYTCDKCGRGYPDCWDDAPFCKCGAHFCCDDCGKPVREYDEEEDCDMVVSCCVCRRAHVTDEQLFQFLLKRAGLTHKQALALYKKENKGSLSPERMRPKSTRRVVK